MIAKACKRQFVALLYSVLWHVWFGIRSHLPVKILLEQSLKGQTWKVVIKQLSVNKVTHIMCDVGKLQRPSEDLLHDPYWLPVRLRIYYRIIAITFRAIGNNSQPISSLLVNYPPPLHSTNQDYSTYLVHIWLLAHDASHLLLQPFGIIYHMAFTLLEESALSKPDCFLPIIMDMLYRFWFTFETS